MQSEASLNQYGRPSDHLFRDLRSASRAKRRTRKHLKRYNNFRSLTPADLPSHSSQQPHYLPLCQLENCPTSGTADACCFSVFPADLSTAPVAQFTKRTAYLEAQHSRPVIKHHSRVKNDSLKWSKRRHDKRDAVQEVRDEEWRGDLWEDDEDWTYYCDVLDPGMWTKVYGVPQEALESWDTWTEVGETFERWCQRRIGEMRAVKEERLREVLRSKSQSQSPSTPSVPRDDDEDEGYHSSSSTSPSTSPSPASTPTTTLPSSPSDTHAHALIKSILTPHSRLKWLRHPRIHGFWWFGEYTWYWHRNMSGCWYFTSYLCEKKPWFGCHCDEFGGAEWEGWDPEGVWVGRLGEWMGKAEVVEGDRTWEEIGESEDGWDVVFVDTEGEDVGEEEWEQIYVDLDDDLDII